MSFKSEIVVDKEWIQVTIQNSLKSDLKKDLNGSQKSDIFRRKFSMEFEWNMNHLNCFKKVLKEFCMIFKLNLNSNGIWMTKGSILNGVWMIDELQRYFKLILNINLKSRDHTSSKVPHIYATNEQFLSFKSPQVQSFSVIWSSDIWSF